MRRLAFIVLLLCSAETSYGGVYFVNTANTTLGSSAITCMVTLTAGLNDTIVVGALAAFNGSSVSGVSDNANPPNVYSKVPPSIATSGNVKFIEEWVANATNPATAITVTYSQSNNHSCIAGIYRGSVAVITSSATVLATTSANPSISLSLKNGNAFMVSVFAWNSANAFTVATGKLRGQVTNAGTPSGLALMDNVGTDATTVTTAATVTSVEWAAKAVELRSRLYKFNNPVGGF